MLDRIANIVIGLDGEGNAGAFADYAQWEAWLEAREQAKKLAKAPERAAAAGPATSKKKLSYLEEREWSTIEERIAQAEEVVAKYHAELEDPVVATDASRLQVALADVAKSQEIVDDLYTRWGQLEAKRN
jgi:ATP-binding cassette subfamily F protein uup